MVPLQAAAVLAVFAGAGALLGMLWERWWTPPKGVVEKHVWYPGSETALRAQFTGTGLFVVLGLGAGVVLGLLAAWLLARVEVITVAAVAGGAVLAAYVMMRVGVHLGPPDAQTVARTTADGGMVPGNLRLAHGLAPYAGFPIGALGASAIVLFIPRRRR